MAYACPYCEDGESRVLDSRALDNGFTIRRRRECTSCSRRFTTYEREKKILNMRFFHGKTQMEVAEEIGISQAQVSRLEKAALNHMQKYI
jgi:RNA polymerase sigma factor (sigma-70 family)